MMLGLAACSADDDDIERVDEHKLGACLEGRGVDPKGLSGDLTTLPPEQAEVLEACLRKQRSSLAELIAYREAFRVKSDRYVIAERDCMREKGWDIPEPVRDEHGVLFIKDYDQYGQGQEDAFFRDHEACSQIAHDKVQTHRAHLGH